MTKASRWALVFFILAMATIVALLPRTEEDPGTAPLSSEGKSAVAENDAVLAPLRERAAMRPCPRPEPDAPKPAGPLTGISVPCLGAPGSVDLGAALAGKATLVNLWASWCGPCREEMPVLAAYAEQPGAIDVLGINVLDRTSSALEMVTELGVDYPSVYNPAEALQRALRVPPVLPVNYLVKPNGTVERITDPLIFNSPDQVHTAVQRHSAGDHGHHASAWGCACRRAAGTAVVARTYRPQRHPRRRVLASTLRRPRRAEGRSGAGRPDRPDQRGGPLPPGLRRRFPALRGPHHQRRGQAPLPRQRLEHAGPAPAQRVAAWAGEGHRGTDRDAGPLAPAERACRASRGVHRRGVRGPAGLLGLPAGFAGRPARRPGPAGIGGRWDRS